MGVLKLMGISLVLTALGSLLRSYKPELRLPFSIACLLLFLAFFLKSGADIFSKLAESARGIGLDPENGKFLLKMIAMAYIVEFSAELCRDAGEGALAVKVETAGKFLLLASMLPLLERIFRVLESFGSLL